MRDIVICQACEASGEGRPRYCSCCGSPLEASSPALGETQASDVSCPGPLEGPEKQRRPAQPCRSCGVLAADGRDHCDACESMLAVALRAHQGAPVAEADAGSSAPAAEPASARLTEDRGTRVPATLGTDDTPGLDQVPLPWWKARRPTPDSVAVRPASTSQDVSAPAVQPLWDPWTRVTVAVTPPAPAEAARRPGTRKTRGPSSWTRAARVPIGVSPGWAALTIAASLAALVVSVWGADLPGWLPPVTLGHPGASLDDAALAESAPEAAPSPAPDRTTRTSPGRRPSATPTRLTSDQGPSTNRAVPGRAPSSGPGSRRTTATRPRAVAEAGPRPEDPARVPREAPAPTLTAAALALAMVPTATPSAPAPIAATVERADAALAFEITQVDVRPQVERRVEPDYPDRADEGGFAEVVVLRVLVSAAGTPSAVRVLRRSRIGPVADDAAVAAVRQWRFSPARKRDQAVDCWFNVGVPLRGPGTDSSS